MRNADGMRANPAGNHSISRTSPHPEKVSGGVLLTPGDPPCKIFSQWKGEFLWQNIRISELRVRVTSKAL